MAAAEQAHQAAERRTAAVAQLQAAVEELRHVRVSLEHTHADVTRKTVELDDRAREETARIESIGARANSATRVRQFA